MHKTIKNSNSFSVSPTQSYFQDVAAACQLQLPLGTHLRAMPLQLEHTEASPPSTGGSSMQDGREVARQLEGRWDTPLPPKASSQSQVASSCAMASCLPAAESASLSLWTFIISWLWGPVPAAPFISSAGDLAGTFLDNLFRVCSPTFPSYRSSLVLKTVIFI